MSIMVRRAHHDTATISFRMLQHSSSPEENPPASSFAVFPLSEEGNASQLHSVNEHVAALLVRNDETLMDVVRRLEEPLAFVQNEGGGLILVFPKHWKQQVPVRARQELFALLGPYREHIAIATHDRVLQVAAQEGGVSVLQERDDLRARLGTYPHAATVVRHFSAEQWQQSAYVILQKFKALSMHRISLVFFLGGSILLLGTVLFIALPSATVRIWPAMSMVSHTANIVLVTSGATLDMEPKYTLPLLPIRTTVQKTIQFTEISKKFLGENAETEMTIVNESSEQYSLRAGTRLVNQAGMIFRTLSSVQIPPLQGVEPGIARTLARAVPKDLYGQILGERGNVPAGLKWEIPGLSMEERELVYARNVTDATGGVSRYGRELQEQDLELAQKQMEQELQSAVKMRVEEDVTLLREQDGKEYVVLQYEVLTGMSFSGVVLPLDLLGEEVESIPVSGSLSYEVLAYDKQSLLELLLPGLLLHVEEGRELIETSVVPEGISVHVIEYDDDRAWVKITAELTGKQRSVLAQTSQAGRIFTERVREMVLGKDVQDAARIIQNFPEVERVDISMWPPWRGTLPSLMRNIRIIPE
jgi:limonene-1,2-epoxide hydrolase